MFRAGSKFVVLAVVAGLAIPLSAQKTRKHKKPKPAAVREQAPTPPPPLPEPPPVPLRPEQMAPNPPQVTFQDNQLTIVADNSTLSSILAAVRVRTGANLDMPRDVANDRVVARLGPGDPRDVLSALLQGSRFDYILLGSESDPNALSQIILTSRAGAGATPSTVPAVASPGARAAAPPPPPPPADEEDTADTQPEPQPETPPQPQPQQSPPVVSPVTPPPTPPEIGPTTPESETPGQSTTPGQAKTPEQLLQELQRMRQQQEQNPQQQPPPNRPQQRREPPQ